MAQTSKYLFETEFDRGGRAAHPRNAEPDPATTPVYTAVEMDRARAEAHAQGVAEGLAEARAEIAAAAAQTLEGVATDLTSLLTEIDSVSERARKDAAALAFLIGKKLARALLDREPQAEVEAMIARCLADLNELGGDHRVVVRVAPMLVEALNDQVTALTARIGFAGRFLILGDESMQGADCRVEWADGGAERTESELERAIGESIDRYLQSSSQQELPPRPDDDDRFETPEVREGPQDNETLSLDKGSKSVRLSGPGEDGPPAPPSAATIDDAVAEFIDGPGGGTDPGTGRSENAAPESDPTAAPDAGTPEARENHETS